MKKWYWIYLVLFVMYSVSASAVTSVMVRHNTGVEFAKGTTDGVVIDSNGTLRLARHTEHVDCGDLLNEVWTIGAMAVDGRGALFLGTGPNGRVVRVLNDAAVQVYPKPDDSALAPSDILNQHVFALGLDVADRLLIGISGEKGKLVRLGGEIETVFEHDDVQYIFAIVRDADNNIYLGTGPKGHIIKLDPFCQKGEMFYTAQDKNILSLAIDGGVLYAGADQRGLIYKITLADGAASVLYDAEQSEIAALWVDDKHTVYAAATNAQVAAEQLKAASQALAKSPGRPDAAPTPDATDTASMNTAASDTAKEQPQPQQSPPPPPPPAPRGVGQIFRITPEGFVTPIFSEPAVFYAMQRHEGLLWLGTGNNGRLYTVDSATEEKSIAYEDTLSSQITTLAVRGESLYLGLSNPARLVRLDKGFARRGVYESAMVDAAQPAQWGKLQVDAELPAGCGVSLSCRSGNVGDIASSALSAWTAETPLTEPTELTCPVGRFMQYRLALTTEDASRTPRIRETVVSHVVPNLPPVVAAVRTARSRDKAKPGVFEITFDAQDPNKDELVYKIEFRRIGRQGWILLKDDLEKPRFEWDSRTVEDGRYEVRLTADDRRGNCPATAMTGVRISDPFVIDNTPPQIESEDIQTENGVVVLRLRVRDALTIVGKVAFTVNSNDKWNSVLPDDNVYDTTVEMFTLYVPDPGPGVHVVAVSVADDVGNIQYKSYEINL